MKENQIEYELKGGKFLDLNLYEIRLEKDIINCQTLLEAFLFDCQCVLFLVDKTVHNSITHIKNIFSFLDKNKYHHLKKIIVENKSDIMQDTENKELKKLINFYSNSDYVDFMEISLKSGENLDKILNMIYNAVNLDLSEKNGFPLNKISKSISNNDSFKDCKTVISLILVGNSGVGKTNFALRYFKNIYNSSSLATFGIMDDSKKLRIDNEYYKLTIWDTAGQERFRRLPRKYYRNVDGVLLFFDINDKKSFEDVSMWMNEINENSGITKEEKNIDSKKNDLIIYLIGNKIDLMENTEKKVTKQEIDMLINQLGIKYYEISCRWNLNIEEVMARIVLDCIKKVKNKSNNFELTNVTKNKKSKCC